MSEFDLPKGWLLTSLGEIADWGSGGTPSRKTESYYGGTIPWVKTGDLGPKVLTQASEFITEQAVANSSAKFFPKGSVAIAMYGATIGKTSILGIDATTNQACGVGNPIKGVTFTEFLYYMLCNEKDNFIAKGKGGAQPNISQVLIKEHEIALPPLAEQQQIAKKLDELLAQVDTLKTRLDAIPKILKRFRQSVLAAAVSGGLTDDWRKKVAYDIQKIELHDLEIFWANEYKNNNRKFKLPNIVSPEFEIQALPSSWLGTQLGYVFDIYVGATPSRIEKNFWGGDVNWVSSSEVAFRRIKYTKEKITEKGLNATSTHVHPKGTVMLAMIGQGKTRGQVAVLDVEACHNQNTAALRIPAKFVLPEYLYFYLWKQYEETRRVGGGNNQQALNKATVQGLNFPLPPIQEQTEIIRRVEQLFAYADQIEQRVKDVQARVNHLTQSILAKAFRGELTAEWRAQNPELISGENSAAALLERIKAEREAIAKPKKKMRA